MSLSNSLRRLRRYNNHVQNPHRTKRCKLRQHIITVLCYLLRFPFALLDLLARPFRRRAWVDPHTIVLIKPCCLGDLVMTTPLLEVIWRAYPAAQYDLAFVLDRSPMLPLLPWLAGIPRRVGPDSLGRGFSLTDRVPVSSSPTHLQHQAEIYLDLARSIALPIGSPRMRFEPTAK